MCVFQLFTRVRHLFSCVFHLLMRVFHLFSCVFHSEICVRQLFSRVFHLLMRVFHLLTRNFHRKTRIRHALIPTFHNKKCERGGSINNIKSKTQKCFYPLKMFSDIAWEQHPKYKICDFWLSSAVAGVIAVLFNGRCRCIPRPWGSVVVRFPLDRQGCTTRCRAGILDLSWKSRRFDRSCR